jgi:sulfide:quinone oxidoreductase
MIVPPFLGQPVVESVPGLADAKGYVPVRDTCQSVADPNICAVGIAAAVTVPWTTAVPVGVPKTGFPTEIQAHVAADNIAAQIRGEEPSAHKEFGDIPAVRDGRRQQRGTDPGRQDAAAAQGRGDDSRPQSHAARLLFERYFLWRPATATCASPDHSA